MSGAIKRVKTKDGSNDELHSMGAGERSNENHGSGGPALGACLYAPGYSSQQGRPPEASGGQSRGAGEVEVHARAKYITCDN